jgi:hypothetical protein
MMPLENTGTTRRSNHWHNWHIVDVVPFTLMMMMLLLLVVVVM